MCNKPSRHDFFFMSDVVSLANLVASSSVSMAEFALLRKTTTIVLVVYSKTLNYFSVYGFLTSRVFRQDLTTTWIQRRSNKNFAFTKAELPFWPLVTKILK